MCSAGCGERPQHPWNCAPPLSTRLGPKHSPLSQAPLGTTSSRAEGEGTRFVWVDPRNSAGGVLGIPPFACRHALSVPDHEPWRCRLHFRVSGLPLPLARCAWLQRPRADRRGSFAVGNGKSVFQIVKELRAGESAGKGVSGAKNAKTPVMRYGVDRGSRGSPGGACGAGNLPELFRGVTACRSQATCLRGDNR